MSNRAPASANAKSHLVVTQEQAGKLDVEFQSKNGTTTSKVQLYQNIDLLVSDSQSHNVAKGGYKVITDDSSP